MSAIGKRRLLKAKNRNPMCKFAKPPTIMRGKLTEQEIGALLNNRPGQMLWVANG